MSGTFTCHGPTLHKVVVRLRSSAEHRMELVLAPHLPGTGQLDHYKYMELYDVGQWEMPR